MNTLSKKDRVIPQVITYIWS